jgi:hypothetical protein
MEPRTTTNSLIPGKGYADGHFWPGSKSASKTSYTARDQAGAIEPDDDDTEPNSASTEGLGLLGKLAYAVCSVVPILRHNIDPTYRHQKKRWVSMPYDSGDEDEIKANRSEEAARRVAAGEDHYGQPLPTQFVYDMGHAAGNWFWGSTVQTN